MCELRAGRRGVLSAASGDADVGASLLRCATEHGAASLGVHAGAIEPGRWADFALVDLSRPALAGCCTADPLLPALIFGCAADAVVCATCVGGRWHGLDAGGGDDAGKRAGGAEERDADANVPSC